MKRTRKMRRRVLLVFSFAVCFGLSWLELHPLKSNREVLADFALADAGSSEPSRIALRGPSEVAPHQCLRLTIDVLSDGESLIASQEDIPFSIVDRSPVRGGLFSDPNCLEPFDGPLLVPAGQSWTSIFYRVEEPTSIQIDLLATGWETRGWNSRAQYGHAVRVKVNWPAPPASSTCSGPFHLQAQDRFGNEVPFGEDPTSLQLSYEGGDARFYRDADCSPHGEVSTVSISPGGTQSAPLYFKGSEETSIFLRQATGDREDFILWDPHSAEIM